ncbi:MAG: YvcK family protein [Candidatus Peribacteria bacterium]|nr:YvcK family protein [Candidatus Peribacteria bacterium]
MDLELDETCPLIKRAFLTPSNVKANPRAANAISKADYIIICFGDLYTSIIPNFLVR